MPGVIFLDVITIILGEQYKYNIRMDLVETGWEGVD
jgi:hypothetical protein